MEWQIKHLIKHYKRKTVSRYSHAQKINHNQPLNHNESSFYNRVGSLTNSMFLIVLYPHCVIKFFPVNIYSVFTSMEKAGRRGGKSIFSYFNGGYAHLRTLIKRSFPPSGAPPIFFFFSFRRSCSAVPK